MISSSNFRRSGRRSPPCPFRLQLTVCAQRYAFARAGSIALARIRPGCFSHHPINAGYAVLRAASQGRAALEGARGGEDAGIGEHRADDLGGRPGARPSRSRRARWRGLQAEIEGDRNTAPS